MHSVEARDPAGSFLSGAGILSRGSEAAVAPDAAAAMPVYYINLDARPDRRTHMEAQARALGVALTRMPAVDAASAAIQEALAAGRARGRTLTAGEIACTESHRACWEALLATGADHAVILEDDVLLVPDFASLTRPGWVPADVDVVKLETWGGRVHLGYRRPIRAGSRELCRLTSRHFGSAGYVITRAAAERLLHLTEEAEAPIDHTLFCPEQPTFSKLAVYQMTPAPVVQAHRKTGAAADWAASDIATNHRGDSTLASPLSPREPAVARLRRRLANEWRAFRQGTRYVVVAHG